MSICVNLNVLVLYLKRKKTNKIQNLLFKKKLTDNFIQELIELWTDLNYRIPLPLKLISVLDIQVFAKT